MATEIPMGGFTDNVLAEADNIVHGERQTNYGDPVDVHTRIGMAWAAVLGLPEPIPPRTVAWMMVVLKIMRDTTGKPIRDNPVDVAGYAAIADMCVRPPF